MPRVARVILPGSALHVRQRGHNRERCFFSDPDYVLYLRLLGLFARRHDCRVHAYCLMTNHVHLLLTPPDREGCSGLMKVLTQVYTQQINKSRQRTGSLWEGRFRSCVVGSERYALACYRYIELNPVQAGMVSCARDYRWSSYRANAEGCADPLVDPHPAFPGPSAYRGMFEEPLDSDLVHDIRRATSAGCAAGSPRKPRGPHPRRKVPVPI